MTKVCHFLFNTMDWLCEPNRKFAKNLLTAIKDLVRHSEFDNERRSDSEANEEQDVFVMLNAWLQSQSIPNEKDNLLEVGFIDRYLSLIGDWYTKGEVVKYV